MTLNPNHIPSISKISFTIGGYFDGYETRTVLLDGEAVRMTVTHSLHPEVREIALSMTNTEFLNHLCELHIESWKSKYIDPDILDGTQWELAIYFSNGHKPVNIAGSNAYPDNFAELERLFGIEE